MIAIDSTTDNITTRSSSSSTLDAQPAHAKTSRRRRVRFECDNNIVIVVHQESDPMSSLEVQAYFMQRKDYERSDKDINESVKKWVQFQAGRIVAFDEERFSVRGVEGVLNHMKCLRCPKKPSRIQQTKLQIRAVLKASKHQPANLEQLRYISQSYSKAALDLAVRTGERDAAWVLRSTTVQDENPAYFSSSRSSSKHPFQQECATPVLKDKKSRLGQRFSFLRKQARSRMPLWPSPPLTGAVVSV